MNARWTIGLVGPDGPVPDSVRIIEPVSVAGRRFTFASQTWSFPYRWPGPTACFVVMWMDGDEIAKWGAFETLPNGAVEVGQIDISLALVRN